MQMRNIYEQRNGNWDLSSYFPTKLKDLESTLDDVLIIIIMTMVEALATSARVSKQPCHKNIVQKVMEGKVIPTVWVASH